MNSKLVTFRAIRKDDIPFLRYYYSRNNLSKYSSRFMPYQFIKHSRITSNLHLWLAILVKKKIVGSIWAEKTRHDAKTGRLGILIHLKAYWSKGYGSCSLEKAIPVFSRKLGINKIALNVRSSNSRAISCYEKTGFVIRSKGVKETKKRAIPFLSMMFKTKSDKRKPK